MQILPISFPISGNEDSSKLSNINKQSEVRYEKKDVKYFVNNYYFDFLLK